MGPSLSPLARWLARPASSTHIRSQTRCDEPRGSCCLLQGTRLGPPAARRAGSRHGGAQSRSSASAHGFAGAFAVRPARAPTSLVSSSHLRPDRFPVGRVCHVYGFCSGLFGGQRAGPFCAHALQLRTFLAATFENRPRSRSGSFALGLSGAPFSPWPEAGALRGAPPHDRRRVQLERHVRQTSPRAVASGGARPVGARAPAPSAAHRSLHTHERQSLLGALARACGPLGDAGRRTEIGPVDRAEIGLTSWNGVSI